MRTTAPLGYPAVLSLFLQHCLVWYMEAAECVSYLCFSTGMFIIIIIIIILFLPVFDTVKLNMLFLGTTKKLLVCFGAQDLLLPLFLFVLHWFSSVLSAFPESQLRVWHLPSRLIGFRLTLWCKKRHEWEDLPCPSSWTKRLFSFTDEFNVGLGPVIDPVAFRLKKSKANKISAYNLNIIKLSATPIRMANIQDTGNTDVGQAVRREHLDARSGQWELCYFLLKVGMQEKQPV